MEFSKYDLFAYQILDYLVIKYNYQIIRVQQHKDDIWLMNPQQETYPVIRISSKSNDVALSDTEYIRNVHRVILNLIQREGPILILNTNPDSTPIDNVMMTQIRITPNNISDDKILSTFHGLKEVVHESEDVNGAIAAISKEIEETELARQKKMIEGAISRSRPKLTILTILICVGVSLAALVLLFLVKDSASALVASGAYYKMNVVAVHEYWRLFTAGFLHQDPITLLLNMLVLYYVGKNCEHLFTKQQFIITIILSIVMGNVFTLICENNALSMGIGAAVYGLLGSYLVHLFSNGAYKHPLIRFSLMKMIAASVLLLLVAGLSPYAYLGGFLSGVILGLLYSDVKGLKAIKQHTVIATMLLLIGLGYLGFKSTRIEPIDQEFDTSVINIYRHTPLNSYAEYLQRCYNKQYQLEGVL